MKKEITRGLAAITASSLIIVGFGTSVAMSYSDTINTALGVETKKMVNKDEKEVDTNYYKSAYGELSDENLELVIADAYAQAVNEEAEGAVLLKNENQALPLKDTEKRITLFGHAVADPLYKPKSGGATIAEENLITFYDAMTKAGFEINDTLFTAYENSSTVRSTGVSQGPGQDKSDPVLGEESIDFYTNDLKSSWEDDYNDAAVVMFAREGGEDTELLMHDTEGLRQLALHQDEKDLLKMINDSGKFEKIIVLINSPWAMELDWLEEYNVDACLWIGNTGLRGFEGVANLLSGEVNPSGKLVDTYASNSMSSPAATYAADNTQSCRYNVLSLFKSNRRRSNKPV